MIIKRVMQFCFVVGALSFAACGGDDGDDLLEQVKDEAKSAVESELGVAKLESADIDAMKTAMGWVDTDPKYQNLKIRFGLRLTDKFDVDMSSTAEIPIPAGIDASAFDAANASGNNKFLLVAKTAKITLGDSVYTRLEVINVAQVKEGKLVINGEDFNKSLDPGQIVSKANSNQAGDYLFIQGSGDGGIVGLMGTVNLQKADGSALVPVKDTYVFTTTSPFVGRSGSTGKYFVAMLQGADGQVIGFNSGIGAIATGTPQSTTTVVAKAGLLDNYKDDVTGKAAGIPGVETADASAAFDKLNKVVTDYVDGWQVVETPLTFVQPPQAPPAAAEQPTPPAVAEAPTEPATSDESNRDIAEDKRGEGTIVRGAAGGPQVDLACTGKDKDGKSTLIVDGSDTTTKGWRFFGDAGITNQGYDKIFPTDSVDTAKGYCVVTTGDGQYQDSDKKASIYAPQGGKTSEMWQQVAVPADMKTVQLRIAVLTQEYPQYVGSGFNDSFYVKFDEAIDPIAAGTLNDLGGVDNSDKSCFTNYGTADKIKAATDKAACGEWISTYHGLDLGTSGDANYWMITKSSQAPSHTAHGSKYACANTDGEKCYAGMLPPKIVCKPIPESLKGKTATLRIGVSDAGDSYFDTAVAVDSIVFSKEECAKPFVADPAVNSRVLD